MTRRDSPTTHDPLPQRSRRTCVHHLDFTEPHSHGNRRVQQARAVRSVYRDVYGARLSLMMPWLLSMHDADDAVLGVIGGRPARSAPLFLEAYLDEPIETVLSSALGMHIWRDELVEVGNLAARVPGMGRSLVTSLAALIAGAGGRWAVFTATDELRGLFARLGIALVDLAPADGRRLGDELAHWGTYYDADPRVSAARIDDVRAAAGSDVKLRRSVGVLWQRSYLRGCRLAAEAVA